MNPIKAAWYRGVHRNMLRMLETVPPGILRGSRTILPYAALPMWWELR